jgi:hypothetical protein
MVAPKNTLNDFIVKQYTKILPPMREADKDALAWHQGV